MKTDALDTFYTSERYANELMNFVDFSSVQTVADICVGGGQLLEAALRKKQTLTCYGTDIDRDVVNVLKKRRPLWNLAICDVLDEEERSKTFLFKNKFDLLVLNPPFTCRGSVVRHIQYKGVVYHVSTAMSFLVSSLDLINDSGAIYAIMPIGTINSQKDSAIWAQLFQSYRVQVHQESERVLFGDREPNVVILSLRKGHTNRPFFEIPCLTLPFEFKLYRGAKNMFLLGKHPGGIQLIHTTSLRENKVSYNLTVSQAFKCVKGPGVLIPRVGLPKKDKICLMMSKQRAVLSDCVILISTKTSKDSRMLKQMLLDDWDNFSCLYKGTGAKYVTIDKLNKYLRYRI